LKKHPVLLDIALKEASQAAQKLDEDFASNGQLKGPLHGLPVTFKDIFHAADLETSGSYVAWFEPPNSTSPPRYNADYQYLPLRTTNFEDNPKAFDSQVSAKLKAQGAVPIAKVR
jgi:Asp-tRNA(Asn)/Glu-tRNA(Gln) amidotransferase A subunit family amidase